MNNKDYQNIRDCGEEILTMSVKEHKPMSEIRIHCQSKYGMKIANTSAKYVLEFLKEMKKEGKI